MIVLDRANGACCPELTTMEEVGGRGQGQFLIILQAEVMRLHPRGVPFQVVCGIKQIEFEF